MEILLNRNINNACSKDVNSIKNCISNHNFSGIVLYFFRLCLHIYVGFSTTPLSYYLIRCIESVLLYYPYFVFSH